MKNNLKEYKSNADFIAEVVETKELNNEIRMTDDKQYLVTLQNAHEDVKADRDILCAEGDLERCVQALKDSKNNWVEHMQWKKLHKSDYKYFYAEKKIDDVDLAKVQRVKEKFFNIGKNVVFIVRDNGRVIIAFRNKVIYEGFLLASSRGEVKGENWTQYGAEKILSWSDEIDNYNVVVAEFWTDEKLDDELSGDADAMYRAHWGIQEPTDRPRSPFDVYSHSELL
ncbi:hypothetical protein [Bacillus cereus]|uniref:hypothetical protein n=1 Tax=Bacillus cereus TaxID=1396 RepID=UPI00032E3130|nr:hypothetical protein [Bacillus cereus]EOO44133.1 hypothetical protein ICK_06390 [Bacillus cereus BAG1X2-2]EOP00283.1 hypothetical protein ICO_06239 [Bacillus cereus BAG2O-1]